MKRTALVICSILLIAVSVFGIVAAGLGIKDGLAIKAYKEEDAKAADVVGQLEEGIYQLKENEQAYLDGSLAYSEGSDTLSAGYKAYYEGLAQYEAGKKTIEENTQAYNEGKETLATMEKIMPLVDKYVEFRDGTVGNLDGFHDAQAWFASKVIPLAAQLGLDIPADVTDLPAYIQQMVADGQAQIKAYEDGVAQLAAAEKQLADAQSQLAAGEAALADGKSQLAVFEEGMVTVNGYTMICFKNSPVYRFGTDEIAVDGPEQMLGSDYTWVKYDENGDPVLLLNGEPYLDLDKCLEVCATFRQSVDNHVASVEHELYMRLGLYIAVIVAALLGIIAGIRGISGKVPKLGIVVAIIAVACNIFGAITGYAHYIYPTRDMDSAGNYIVDAAGEYVHSASGDLQFAAIIIFAVGAVIFALAAVAYASKAKKEASSDDEEVYETA